MQNYNLEDAKAYLAAYGWAAPAPRDLSVAPAPVPIDNASAIELVKRAIEFAFGAERLKTSGGLVDLLSKPRCRVPDRLMEAGGVCKWPHSDIRFWQSIKLPGISERDVTACWEAAVASWAAVCGIWPEYALSQAQANVWATAGSIDGPGSTLAWSYLPCGFTASQQVEQRYDTGERWASYGLDYLQEVMAHEIGHALGIDHLPAGNLMAPYATGKIVEPQLGDVKEAVKRYGGPIVRPKPQPPTPTPEPPVPTTSIVIEVNGKRYRVPAVEI